MAKSKRGKLPDGLLRDEAREQGTQHEPALARAVVHNDVLGLGATEGDARADALPHDTDARRHA